MDPKAALNQDPSLPGWAPTPGRPLGVDGASDNVTASAEDVDSLSTADLVSAIDDLTGDTTAHKVLTAEVVGVADGTQECTTSTFTVVIDEEATVELDDLVAVSQITADKDEVTHYGIVIALDRAIEGASWSSDSVRFSQNTQPGSIVRRATVQILRPYPERWLAPEPGQEVRRAVGTERDQALFADHMGRPLPVGVDARRQPVMVDVDFIDGTKGGHVNVSGISGVATKTSSLLTMLYQLFETPAGLRHLGVAGAQARVLILSVKNEDLLHLDKPNVRFSADARDGWAAMGVSAPGPFTSVSFHVPPKPGGNAAIPTADVSSRSRADVSIFGWTPWEFVIGGLLSYLLADADDARNQLSFVEQRVRAALTRWCWPLPGIPGGIALADPAGVDDVPRSFERATEYVSGRRVTQTPPGAHTPVTEYGELVAFLEDRFDLEQAGGGGGDFYGSLQANTCLAFLRRLGAMTPRLGHLVRLGVTAPGLERRVTVVDLHALHDSAQRFVVGAVADRIFTDKQGSGRDPLRIIMMDEANKFAPESGRSPLKDLLVDIAERGRSMGVILFSAQQHAGSVAPTIIRNASVKLVGRLDAGDLDAYRFLPVEMRQRATLFVPGSMVLHQPVIPAPLPIRIPFPPFATSADEVPATHGGMAISGSTGGNAGDLPDGDDPFDVPDQG